jgi:hypothetical protein
VVKVARRPRSKAVPHLMVFVPVVIEVFEIIITLFVVVEVLEVVPIFIVLI